MKADYDLEFIQMGEYDYEVVFKSRVVGEISYGNREWFFTPSKNLALNFREVEQIYDKMNSLIIEHTYRNFVESINDNLQEG